jgi:hypothetical protein
MWGPGEMIYAGWIETGSLDGPCFLFLFLLFSSFSFSFPFSSFFFILYLSFPNKPIFK